MRTYEQGRENFGKNYAFDPKLAYCMKIPLDIYLHHLETLLVRAPGPCVCQNLRTIQRRSM